jgi:hypothetical protein
MIILVRFPTSSTLNFRNSPKHAQTGRQHMLSSPVGEECGGPGGGGWGAFRGHIHVCEPADRNPSSPGSTLSIAWQAPTWAEAGQPRVTMRRPRTAAGPRLTNRPGRWWPSGQQGGRTDRGDATNQAAHNAARAGRGEAAAHKAAGPWWPSGPQRGRAGGGQAAHKGGRTDCRDPTNQQPQSSRADDRQAATKQPSRLRQRHQPGSPRCSPSRSWPSGPRSGRDDCCARGRPGGHNAISQAARTGDALLYIGMAGLLMGA